jgi:hypothetical protein
MSVPCSFWALSPDKLIGSGWTHKKMRHEGGSIRVPSFRSETNVEASPRLPVRQASNSYLALNSNIYALGLEFFRMCVI